jgi:hypothetical protein
MQEELALGIAVVHNLIRNFVLLQEFQYIVWDAVHSFVLGILHHAI